MNPQEIIISLLIAKHCLQDPEISDRIQFEMNLNPEDTESLLVKLKEHFNAPAFEDQTRS
jgi:hypothetical protein